jgi:hypothetical protein
MKAASDQIKDLPSLFAWLRADHLGELRKKLVVARFGHQRRVWSEAACRQADKPEKLLLLGDLQTPYREGRWVWDEELRDPRWHAAPERAVLARRNAAWAPAQP